MPHVSRKKIEKKVAHELAGQFLALLSSVQTKKEASIFANELLSQTERVMLAKRIAIVVCLVRGYSFTQIEQALGVTPQTIVRIWRGMKNGTFTHIVRYARTQVTHFRKESFADALIRLIHFGMPPRAGKGRWKFLNNTLDN